MTYRLVITYRQTDDVIKQITHNADGPHDWVMTEEQGLWQFTTTENERYPWSALVRDVITAVEHKLLDPAPAPVTAGRETGRETDNDVTRVMPRVGVPPLPGEPAPDAPTQIMTTVTTPAAIASDARTRWENRPRVNRQDGDGDDRMKLHGLG